MEIATQKRPVDFYEALYAVGLLDFAIMFRHVVVWGEVASAGICRYCGMYVEQVGAVVVFSRLRMQPRYAG